MYTQNGWRPVDVKRSLNGIPVQVPQLPARRMLGQPAANATMDVATDLLALGISGAAAWVGFHTGASRAGLLGVAGYAVGIAGALNALFGVSSLVTDVAAMRQTTTSPVA